MYRDVHIFGHYQLNLLFYLLFRLVFICKYGYYIMVNSAPHTETHFDKIHANATLLLEFEVRVLRERMSLRSLCLLVSALHETTECLSKEWSQLMKP